MAKINYLKLTLDEFNKAHSYTRINSKIKKCCELVLINGMTPAEAERETGVKKQSIHRAVRQLESIVERHELKVEEIPEEIPKPPQAPIGTRWVCVCLPNQTADLIESMSFATRPV